MSDGVTHINVYSMGKTPLGRLLSNFANTPFILNGVYFASVEGWWYWKKSHNDEVRFMHGKAAKDFGRTLPGRGFLIDPKELKEAYHAKVAQNPILRQMLIDSTLPFDHYYVMWGKRRDTEYRWTGLLWEEVRNELKELT